MRSPPRGGRRARPPRRGAAARARARQAPRARARGIRTTPRAGRGRRGTGARSGSRQPCVRLLRQLPRGNARAAAHPDVLDEPPVEAVPAPVGGRVPLLPESEDGGAPALV